MLVDGTINQVIRTAQASKDSITKTILRNFFDLLDFGGSKYDRLDTEPRLDQEEKPRTKQRVSQG